MSRVRVRPNLTNAALRVIVPCHYHPILAQARNLVVLLRWHPTDGGCRIVRARGRGTATGGSRGGEAGSYAIRDTSLLSR